MAPACTGGGVQAGASEGETVGGICHSRGMESWTERFNGLVLTWLRDKGTDAAQIVSVDGSGTDWYGNTEEGFDTHFSASVQYLTASGQREHFNVEGEDMGSLWKWIVSGGA